MLQSFNRLFAGGEKQDEMKKIEEVTELKSIKSYRMNINRE